MRNAASLFFLWAMAWSLAKSHAQSGQLLFVPNEGQWKEDFLYKGVSPFADIYLEKSGVTYVVGAADNNEKLHAIKESREAAEQETTLRYHAYKVHWVNANLEAKTIPSKKQSFYHNYYLGKESGRWKARVGIFGNVDFRDIYPKIDLHFGSEKGNAKYDFIVHPGGDPSAIRFSFEGLDDIRLEKGNLVLQTSVGEIQELAPFAFQYVEGELKEVACHYLLAANGEVYFDFPNGYDPSLLLTIDPVVVFASLTGSTSDNWGFTATYDDAGNLYAGGIANGQGYPTSTGAFQVTFGGGTPGVMPCDISISKFTADGTGLLYSTYLGGSMDEMPHSMVVDKDDNLIVAGKTQSTDYPVTSTAYSSTNSGGFDIVITKFNSSGTALLASTYVGGSGDDGVNISPSFYGVQTTLSYNYGDAFRTEVIIDRNNNVYLAGSTKSSNFPTTASALKSSLGGDQDGVFLKFNPNLSTMLYGTYIGGSADDAAYVLALDTAQANVYVGGGTASSDFHLSAMTGSFQSSYQGGVADGYILKFANSGSYPLLRGTFLGTASYDQCYGVQVDLEDNVYAMGQTLGSFPVSSSVYSNPGSPQFLIKLNPNLNSVIYSTVFGSGPSTHPNISPVAFLVDTCQNVYISGWASPNISPGSSTNNLPITQDAFQSTTDGSDFYFVVFSKNALSLLFASYFGSPGKMEHVDGGTSRFDPNGVVYQAICASCGSGSAFPSTPGAYSSQKGSSNCNLGAVKIAFNLGSVKAQAEATPDAVGCAPLFVQFSNGSANATQYYWDFGDGTPPSSQVTPTHTFTNPGNYTVMMVAINPNACKTHDTVYLTVKVSTDSISADFDLSLADTCGQPNITIQNLSVPIAGRPQSSANYFWDFGDGTTYTGIQPPVHFYQSQGTYQVTLIMTDNDACNSPDTVQKTVEIIQSYVHADFQLPAKLCEKNAVTFTNISQNALSYFWDFGDGQSSTDPTPTHTYLSAGTYTIKLIAYHPNTCNKQDSITRQITISSSPTAAFTMNPLTPEVNKPYQFQNQSQNADQYHWDFGDGNQSSEKNPTHSYNRSGEFKICLTATNSHGCSSVVCKTVRSEVESLADVPSAFSPNGDGANDVLYVRGYNIQEIDLRIYNRWGELVFESRDVNKGWDGTYKGQPQEMEVYAFVLDVVFLDGSKAKKKGNVTLLR